jgi:hypothetical protein
MARSGVSSSAFAELAATAMSPRSLIAPTSRAASRNASRCGMNSRWNSSLRLAAIALPCGVSSRRPLTSGISLSPPMPMQRRT